MPSSQPIRRGALRDSWPPTQLRIDYGDFHDVDLSNIDQDPLTYFLTPTPAANAVDDDDMDFDMDFDAGIEDTKRPAPIVRSVSPSSLDGLSLPPPRPPTPPKSSTPELEFDGYPTPEDKEDYMHLAAAAFDLPVLRLKDLTKKPKMRFSSGHSNSNSRPNSRLDNYRGTSTADYDLPLTPPSPSYSHFANRGRPLTRPGPRTMFRPFRRSPHSWREPSPDVWAIEEETDEELHESEMSDGHHAEQKYAGARNIESPSTASKGKKRVRFALPFEQ
ncbi:hypothetical protein GE21DRAFT_7245 [Neurospora crassa]|uniref:Uncharacterized protein n=2 Tax=Neurospora crassa TaxID=5141 RepID=V5IL38_NEUCR|nr:uncharacterized protein NCU03684 [Neurospora crassa OR74A]XP_011394563.1 hypothetical protein NCU03684 [Neurospora crassa OR74A]KHE88894.1 hypothetical protein GE21DRAFT_7245 [Neurospora crassa]ESA42433.1 hypothetical protein NCU03684 [Neurospora crassa OR74A]ESA42434.1 hypothetical protein, variant [Neurospora crassa OR74A]CAB88611.1 putative protein [Neurospora crassa]|eukprot:XP_011394562.1 uncharacterized protein NCU03684 [Neurospora crassa OR74A]